jgi:Arc/MetJ family transcription regulator
VDDTDGEELVVLEIVCDVDTRGERETVGETLLDIVTDAHAEMEMDTEGDGLMVLEIVGEIDTSGERETVGDTLDDLVRNALAEIEPEAEDEWLRVSREDTVGSPLVDVV